MLAILHDEPERDHRRVGPVFDHPRVVDPGALYGVASSTQQSTDEAGRMVVIHDERTFLAADGAPSVLMTAEVD
jgi:hypothetical protein